MREKSPEAETLRWRTRPTFLAVRGKETGQENQTYDETQGKQSGKTKETTEMVADRTPVKERIIKLNKKAKSSPGKFPGRKQAMVSEYFKSKSPKAKEARDQRKKEPETQNTNFKGASNSPLLGDTGQPEYQQQHLWA